MHIYEAVQMYIMEELANMPPQEGRGEGPYRRSYLLVIPAPGSWIPIKWVALA